MIGRPPISTLFPHTTLSRSDALKAFEGPYIEVHISNIHARDELHRHSLLSSAAKAVICGLGPYGYIVAMQAATQILEICTDRKSTRLNSSHQIISYAVFCFK